MFEESHESHESLNESLLDCPESLFRRNTNKQQNDATKAFGFCIGWNMLDLRSSCSKHARFVVLCVVVLYVVVYCVLCCVLCIVLFWLKSHLKQCRFLRGSSSLPSNPHQREHRRTWH